MEITLYHGYLAWGALFPIIIAVGLRNYYRVSLVAAVVMSVVGIAYLGFSIYAVKEMIYEIGGDERVFIQSLLLQKTPVADYLYKPLAQSYICIIVSAELYILHIVQRIRRSSSGHDMKNRLPDDEN